MGSMNISIKDEAYKFLKSLRGRDESFSDVILRFKEKRGNTGKDLISFVRSYKKLNVDWEEKKKNVKEFKRLYDRDIQEKIKRKGNK